MPYCPECGAEIKRGVKFCPECGTRLAPAAPPAKPAPPKEKSLPPKEKPSPQKVESRVKAGRVLKVAVFTILIVIGLVVVGLVYLLSGRTGGSGLGDIPVYPGAEENAEGTALIKSYIQEHGVSGVEAKGYASTQDMATIASWYRSKMVELGWTKENDKTLGHETSILFKRGNDGAVIVVDNYQKNTLIAILYGPFESNQQFWTTVFH